MLTGAPYQGQKEKPLSWPHRVLQAPTHSGPPRPGSHALWTLVDRLLSLNPQTRPQAQEVVEALGRIRGVALDKTGTLTANRLRRELSIHDASITVIDQDNDHVYQPGLLFIPFGLTHGADIVRLRHQQLHHGIEFVNQAIDHVDIETEVVHLADGTQLPYDVLIVASGAVLSPEETEGLVWSDTLHTFYDLPGATALADALAAFDGGHLVVNVVDLPIKCPVAPLEFCFLADWYFTERGIRDRVDITYDTTGLGKGNVNALLHLSPSKRQSFSVEGFGTNRGGFLGTSLNFNYRHRNVFRTMTSLQASLTLAFEAQQSLKPATASEDASTSLGRGALFNTISIGPELKLGFPLRAGSAKSGGARFALNFLYNYQRRPDYTRTLAKGACGFECGCGYSQSCQLQCLLLWYRRQR